MTISQPIHSIYTILYFFQIMNNPPLSKYINNIIDCKEWDNKIIEEKFDTRLSDSRYNDISLEEYNNEIEKIESDFEKSVWDDVRWSCDIELQKLSEELLFQATCEEILITENKQWVENDFFEIYPFCKKIVSEFFWDISKSDPEKRKELCKNLWSVIDSAWVQNYQNIYSLIKQQAEKDKTITYKDINDILFAQINWTWNIVSQIDEVSVVGNIVQEVSNQDKLNLTQFLENLLVFNKDSNNALNDDKLLSSIPFQFTQWKVYFNSKPQNLFLSIQANPDVVHYLNYKYLSLTLENTHTHYLQKISEIKNRFDLEKSLSFWQEKINNLVIWPAITIHNSYKYWFLIQSISKSPLESPKYKVELIEQIMKLENDITKSINKKFRTLWIQAKEHKPIDFFRYIEELSETISQQQLVDIFITSIKKSSFEWYSMHFLDKRWKYFEKDSLIQVLEFIKKTWYEYYKKDYTTHFKTLYTILWDTAFIELMDIFEQWDQSFIYIEPWVLPHSKMKVLLKHYINNASPRSLRTLPEYFFSSISRIISYDTSADEQIYKQLLKEFIQKSNWNYYDSTAFTYLSKIFQYLDSADQTYQILDILVSNNVIDFQSFVKCINTSSLLWDERSTSLIDKAVFNRNNLDYWYNMLNLPSSFIESIGKERYFWYLKFLIENSRDTAEYFIKSATDFTSDSKSKVFQFESKMPFNIQSTGDDRKKFMSLLILSLRKVNSFRLSSEQLSDHPLSKWYTHQSLDLTLEDTFVKVLQASLTSEELLILLWSVRWSSFAKNLDLSAILSPEEFKDIMITTLENTTDLKQRDLLIRKNKSIFTMKYKKIFEEYVTTHPFFVFKYINKYGTLWIFNKKDQSQVLLTKAKQSLQTLLQENPKNPILYQKIVSTINALHWKENRYAILEWLTPTQLYSVVSLWKDWTDEKIYTSSFNTIISSLIEKNTSWACNLLEIINEWATDSSWSVQNFAFLCMSYRRFGDIIESFNEEDRVQLLSTLSWDIQENPNTISVWTFYADLLHSIAQWQYPKLTDSIREIFLKFYRESSTNHIASILLRFAVDNTVFDKKTIISQWVSPEIFTNDMYSLSTSLKSEIATSDLFTNWTCDQLVLFYDDDDWVYSYDWYIESFKKDWSRKIESKKSYTIISKSWPLWTVRIFATQPKDKDEELDNYWLRKRKWLNAINQLWITPSIVVHRWHSYHVNKTIPYINRWSQIVFLWSCWWSEELSKTLDKNPNAQIISSNWVWTASVNNPLLLDISNELATSNTINREKIRSRRENEYKKELKDDELEVVLDKFSYYLRPDQNTAAAFQAALKRIEKQKSSTN